MRLIVPLAPGGASDIVARLMGQWLSERIGQPFLIENRSGGGTNVGTEAVVRAPADGYTLLMVDTTQAINATLYDKLNFHFIRDITPVASVIRTAIVLVVKSVISGQDSSRIHSPTPKPIPVNSTWRRRATEPSPMSRANCSR